MALSTPGRARRSDSSEPPAPAGLAGLGNRFVELLGRRLSRRSFAAETARLIAAAVRVRAVAILGYDRRRDRLVLLAENGLPPEGRLVLGGGADCTWDIPMRGLRNRRIAVVEAAHQNPFVPPSLVELSSNGLCIASVPLYYDYEPVGVVLLFAAGSRAFPDAHLQTLSQALRVCARGLRDTSGPAMRSARPVLHEQSAAARATREAAPAVVDGAATQAAQVQALAAQQAAADLTAKVQSLEEELRRARDDVDRSAQTVRALTASANAAARERDSATQQLADAERAREVEATELRGQAAALEDRLLAIDSERARFQRMAEARRAAAAQSIQKLESERSGLTQRVTAAEANAVEFQTQLTAERAERERLATHVELLTGQLRAGAEALERTQARYTQERATTEADRDAWKEQATAFRAQLGERSEALTGLDRDLRGTVIARDAATSQLQAARAEIDRLAALGEELSLRATQLEAARAAAQAEGTTLQRALEEERSNRQQIEEASRTDVAAARLEAERLATESAALAAELAERRRTAVERDQQFAALRSEHETTRHAAAESQQANAALRAEAATLTAQVGQTVAERQQLLDERAALRTAQTETRQRASQAEVAYAATLGQIQAEAVEMRRQIETLGADRSALTDRLQRAVEEGRDLTVRLAEAQRRGGDLHERLRQRDEAHEQLANEHEALAAQLATAAGQLQAAQEALDRTRAAAAQDRSVLETQRDEWQEQATTARDELAQRGERLAAVEHDLRSTSVARDAATTELQAISAELDRLTALAEESKHAQTRLEADRAAGLAESTALRDALDHERAGRAETERVLRADLATARTDAERLAAALAARQQELNEGTDLVAARDEQLAALRREIEALRQQSTDRGVLARQASELGSRVVELEQALAAAHGDVARADRQRAALEERLEAARRREGETTAAANQERSALQQALQRLTDERGAAEADKAALGGELDGLRAALGDVQARLEEMRGERARAIDESREATQILSATRQQLEDLGAVQRERDAALAAASAENQRLAAELAAAGEQLQIRHEALAAGRTAAAEEQEALATDRDTWKQQASAARAAAERIATQRDELQRQAAHVEGERSALAAELAAVRRAFEEARIGNIDATETLRAHLAAGRAEINRLVADAATLRSELTERDAQLEVLRQREESTQQAAGEWQHERMGQRAELATLTAQLEERAAEYQQLREGRAALEHQLALITATQGEAEQALAQGLDAARAQIAQLEEERATLNGTAAEARQRLSQAERSHSEAVAQLDAETGKLKRQVQSLTGARTKQAKQLEDVERDMAAHVDRLEREHQRANGLAERCAQLEQSLAAAEAQRAALDADLIHAHTEVGTLTAQLDYSGAVAQALRDERAALERELASAIAGGDEQQQAIARQLQTALQRVGELEQTGATLTATLADTERRMAASDSTHGQTVDHLQAEALAMRQELEHVAAQRDALAERLEEAGRAQAAEMRRSDETAHRVAVLAEQSTQIEQARQAAEERWATAERRLEQAQAEIEALRQQSDDRGVLAHQASELGRTVVDLEQQRAALRGDVARAARERAAVGEELDEARRLQAAAQAAAEQRHAALRETLDRLSEEHRQLEVENAAHAADADALRATLAEVQVESARVRAEGQDATRRLSEMHRRLNELSGALAQRDATAEAAITERQRLTAQVTKLTSQLRAAQETLETMQGRAALERTTAESERDTAKAQAAAARAEVERLSGLATELNDTATQLEAARGSAAAESAALRRSVDEARANHRQAEAALRGDLTAAQAEMERLSADAVAHRTAVSERDEQLTAMRREQEAAQVRDAEMQQATAALRAEVAGLTVQLRESGTESQQLHDVRDALERDLAAATAAGTREAQALQAAREQIGQLEGGRAAAHNALDATREQITAAHAAHATALEALRSESAELRNQLAGVTGERAALSERLQRAEQAVAAQTARAEQDRQHVATLTSRCGQLEQALTAAETRRAGLDGELAKTRTELAALRQQSADRGALAHQASELGSRVRQLEEQLTAQQLERARVERQRVVFEEQLRASRAQHDEAAAAAAREQAALRDTLTRVQEERRHIEADRTERATVADTLQTQVAELRATVGEFTVESERVREETQDVSQRLSETQQRKDELGRLLQQRDAAIQTTTAERERFAELARKAERTAEELANERDELGRMLAELTNQLEQNRLAHAEEMAALARTHTAQLEDGSRAAARPEPEAVEPVQPDAVVEGPLLYQGPLEIERSAPLGALVEGAPEPLDVRPAESVRAHKVVVPSGELVLLDEGALRDSACAALNGAGFEVATFAPTEAGVDDMLRRKVKCVMLNLGSGVAAWHTLRLLRERVGSRNLPILAYIMTKDTPAGFCFGRADFALWPMDPARLIERLGRLRPKLKRLLTLSADVDGMGRMREPLAQAKISTSMVLDGKQALEFATMVDPEAAILHLSPSCPSVSRALAGLRATEATRDMPILLLLDKASAPREDSFFAATGVQLLSKPGFQFTNLPEEIARVIG